MKGSRFLILVVLAVLGLVPVAHAADSTSVAPPGNSAVDQYRESVPPTSSSAGKPSKSQRRSLEREGQDGEDLADVLERSGGVPVASPSGGDRGDGGTPSSGGGPSANPSNGGGSDASSGSVSASGSVSDVSSGGSLPISAVSSTLGPFPIWTMMVVAILLVIGSAIVRRGRST